MSIVDLFLSQEVSGESLFSFSIALHDFFFIPSPIGSRMFRLFSLPSITRGANNEQQGFYTEYDLPGGDSA